MILILGGNSQLANYLSIKIKKSIKVSRRECDITKSNDVKKIFNKYKPKYVFNCAAYHNTILCERFLKKSFMINSFALKNLSKYANIYNSKLIHFSTDYVFDGKKNTPYVETDYPRPLNIYGQSKLLGENFIEQYAKKYLIYRLSSIYSHYPCRHKKGLNFIEKILELSKKSNELNINDLEISPTYVGDIVDQVQKTFKIIENQIVHCTSLGSTTWYKFAISILKANNVSIKVNKVKSFDKDLITRPKYSVLRNSYLLRNKLNVMPRWVDGYSNYIKDQYLRKTNL